MLPETFSFRGKPYDHQWDVLADHWGDSAFALFWEMGTGKTYAIVHNAAALYEVNQIDSLVVVAPKGVYRNWEVEIAKHWPMAIEPIVTTWGRRDARARYSKVPALRVFLVNVEALSTTRGTAALYDWLKSHRCLLVVDESTSVKNHLAQRTKSLIKLARLAPYRRILTGSPITQSPIDLFGQLSVLMPDPMGFNSFYAFKARYAVVTKRVIQVFDPKKGKKVERRFDEVTGYRRLDELQARLAPISSRVLKEECLDLPAKVYTQREVQMTPEQTRTYGEMLDRARATLGSTSSVTAPQAITQILRLHQIVCGFAKDDDGMVQEIRSNRIDALLDAIEEAGSSKVIVWTPYRHSIMAISNEFRETFGAKSFETYFGDTTSEARAHAIERFQTDPECRFFIGNPQTAGYGLTLTAAGTVIYFANSWKLEERMQSEDRAHRIGQTKSVTYVDLVSPGTVDEKIINALRSKHEVASEVLGEQWRTWIDAPTYEVEANQ